MTGETLRRERERQKLTIQDVEQGTSIRSAYIEALEKGDYDSLPGVVYAKGFVKNYAQFLNLDAQKLSAEFSAEVTPAEQIAEVVEENIPAPTSRAEKLKITELKEPDIAISGRAGKNSSASAMIIAAVFLLAILAGGAWYYLSNSAETVAKADPPAPIAETATPAETAPTNPVSAAAPQSGVNVQAKFNGQCWVMVLVDGAFAYEGIPTAGQIMDWHGVEGVTVRVGNAGGIEVSMNGQNYGTLGAVGEVVERTFTLSN